tara:strand:- start:384 stop:1055 length:672 start_codon:yes stop_codon:yes gene_type:complete
LQYQPVTVIGSDYHTASSKLALPADKKPTSAPGMTATKKITALILAGGAGRRVGHRDKGLLPWRGKPLVAHVIDALDPQVDDILISCNRNFERYKAYCANIVQDTRRDFQGPLAGMEAALTCIQTELLVVVSCDMPHLPFDFVEQLMAPLMLDGNDAAEISYAHDGTRAQYLCAGMRTACLTSLPGFLDSGGRAVKDWYRSRHSISVDFSDRHSCFRNYNTLD